MEAVIPGGCMITTFVCRDNKSVFPQSRKMTTFDAFVKNYTEEEGNALFVFWQKRIRKAVRTRSNIGPKTASDVLNYRILHPIAQNRETKREAMRQEKAIREKPAQDNLVELADAPVNVLKVILTRHSFLHLVITDFPKVRRVLT